MKVRYTFDMRGPLQVEPGLIFLHNGYEFEFLVEKSRIRSLCVTIPNVPDEYWPSTEKSTTAGVKLDITIKEPPDAHVVRHHLLSLAGLLGPFGVHGIDTDGGMIKWLPENNDEDEKLKLRSFSRVMCADNNISQIEPIPIDILMRCLIAALGSNVSQAPLTFFCRGREDIFYERHIEAYYDFYFIIETMFADGKTDRKEVVKKFLQSALLMECLTRFLNNPGYTNYLKTVSRSKVEEIIAVKDHKVLLEYIFQKRGQLHHHSEKQGNPNLKWHPAKQDEFAFDAALLHFICYEIIMKLVLEKIYASSIALDDVKVFRRNINNKNSIRFIYSFGRGIVQCHEREIVIEIEEDIVTNSNLSSAQLAEAERKFLAWFADTHSGSYLLSYVSGPAEGPIGRYSEYRAYLPA